MTVPRDDMMVFMCHVTPRHATLPRDHVRLAVIISDDRFQTMIMIWWWWHV